MCVCLRLTPRMTADACRRRVLLELPQDAGAAESTSAGVAALMRERMGLEALGTAVSDDKCDGDGDGGPRHVIVEPTVAGTAAYARAMRRQDALYAALASAHDALLVLPPVPPRPKL